MMKFVCVFLCCLLCAQQSIADEFLSRDPEIESIRVPKVARTRFEMTSRESKHNFGGEFYKEERQDGTWHIQLTVKFGDLCFYFENGKMFSHECPSEHSLPPKEDDSLCYPPLDVPPVLFLQSVFDRARPVLKNDFVVDADMLACPGSLYHIEYTRVPYVLCVVNHRLSHVLSEHFILKLLDDVFLDGRTPLVPPAPLFNYDSIFEMCEQSSHDHPSIQLSPFDAHAMRPGEPSWYELRILSDKMVPCVFLHGVGNTDIGTPADTFPQYWGKVHDTTPQCSKRTFVREETKMRGWDDISLQKAYCAVLLQDQPEWPSIQQYFTPESGNVTVYSALGYVPKATGKIIFAHSMGNLVLAGAIQGNVCDVDTWVEVQGPMAGSLAAKTVVEICTGKTKVEGIEREALVRFGYCIPNTHLPYPAYATMSNDDPRLAGLDAIAQTKVSAALCGTCFSGIVPDPTNFDRVEEWLGLNLIGAYMRYKERSDGMVPWSSCSSGVNGHSFDDHFQSNFYAATINHADGTCRSGDGWWGSSRMPCKWYASRRLPY
eukprot:GILJ01001123.1.p1 GENE.GILJ01001123.1~~GILJ01001123.1.p1  ORF type:complete len:545 (-),score=44.58 GILJ01001123.1:193-1827(-)